MALTVNTNLASLTAQRNLNTSQSDLNTALERLSSGLRINSAKDDAAGLFVTQQMTADIQGTDQAVQNANDGISLGQTAESALGQVAQNLQRIRVLAVQGSNSTVGNADGLQSEVDQLTQEISRIVQTTNFNGTALLSAASIFNFQVGADGDANNQISLDLTNFTTSAGLSSAYNSDLTATKTIDVSSTGAASAALKVIDKALDNVNKKRADFGAVQNRFEAVISNLQVYSDNLTASRSRIQDADFASETAKLTRAQILQQAGTSILAQANAAPQSVLTLLQG